MIIKLELSVQEVQQLRQALGKEPHDQVNALCVKLQMQVMAQQQQKQESADGPAA